MESRIILYGAVATGILILLLLVLLIANMIKMKKLSRAYDKFMRGKDAERLEDVILKRFEEIDILKEEDQNNKKALAAIRENMLHTIQKIGIVKYDAFKEMGGKLSFAIALLDKENNGFVLNSIHSREGCYTYVKEIIDGNSYIVLGEEESNAVKMAMDYKGAIVTDR